MISRPRPPLEAVLLTALLAYVARGAPLPIDGHLDAAYGPALVTQSAGTASNDTLGVFDTSNGRELDEAYGIVRDGALDLLFTGNLELEPNPFDPGTFSTTFHIFFDTRSGGRDTVATTLPPSLLSDLSGLRFDSDFRADAWIGGYGNEGPDFLAPYALRISFARMGLAAQDTVVDIGKVQPVNAGTITGGTNPFGIQAALDNSNRGGVGKGCGTSSGVGASTGLELSIPLAALGNPTGPIKVCAFLMAEFAGGVSNQVLGSVPAGSCDLGDAHQVDFSAIPGPQYFVVGPEVGVPVSPPLNLLLLALGRVPGLVVLYRAPGAEPPNWTSSTPRAVSSSDAGSREEQPGP